MRIKDFGDPGWLNELLFRVMSNGNTLLFVYHNTSPTEHRIIVFSLTGLLVNFQVHNNFSRGAFKTHFLGGSLVWDKHPAHQKNTSLPLSFEDAEEDRKYVCFCMIVQQHSKSNKSDIFSRQIPSFIFCCIVFLLLSSKYFHVYLSRPNNLNLDFLAL